MANAFPQPCDEGVIRARPAGVLRAPVSEPWILAATILGSSMAFIDGTVVNVALLHCKKTSTTVLDVQWVVESYALFLAALLLAGGSMADRFGTRCIFCSGVALFAFASIGCGMAQTISQLIVARGTGHGRRSARAGKPRDPQCLIRPRESRASDRNMVGLYGDN
jgi:hypothetical protein